MVIAPQYATFGTQTFCDRPPDSPGQQADCSNAKHLIKTCSEMVESPTAKQVCTPSVASSFLNRVTINFPFFGAIFFWGQFVFLGVYLLVFMTALARSPKLDERQMDEDAEEAEEEGLLASTGRRIDTAWQNVTGRPGQQQVS